MAVIRVTATLAVLALTLLFAMKQAGADDVQMVDGKRLQGKVIDLGGNAIVLEKDQRRQRIPKKDIGSLNFSVEKRKPLEQDMVIRRTGEIILGRVEVSEDKQSINVHMDNGSVVFLRHRDVARIKLKGEDESEGNLFVYDETVDKRLRRAIKLLSSSRKEKKAAAEKELLKLGVFAIPRVEKILAKDNLRAATRGVLRRVHRMHRIKRVTANSLELMEPDIYEIFQGGDASRKQILLQRAFTYHADDSVPLLELLLLDPDEDTDVRAYGVSLLRNLERNRDLLRLFHQSTGQLQMAIAIALGKNRILIGIPSLIDALDMDDREIRNLAVASLRELTGMEHGYHPADVPSSRREGILRWKEWWKEREPLALKQAEAVLAGETFETPERVKARKLLEKAAIALDKQNFDEAEKRLRKAVSLDSRFMPAAIQLAFLLYTHKRELEEARRILTESSNIKNPDGGATRLTWVHYHLARIHEIEGALEPAINELNRCLVLDPEFFRAHMSLGHLHYETVVRREGLDGDEKFDLLEIALKNFETAINKIESSQSKIMLVDRADLPVDTLPPFDVRKHNRVVLSVKGSLRMDKAYCLMGLAKTLSLLGKRDSAPLRLAEAIDLIEDDDHRAARHLLLKMRNYLAMLYEDLGQFSFAFLEYKRVLRDLDGENPTAREGLRRVRPLVKGPDDRRRR